MAPGARAGGAGPGETALYRLAARALRHICGKKRTQDAAGMRRSCLRTAFGKDASGNGSLGFPSFPSFAVE